MKTNTHCPICFKINILCDRESNLFTKCNNCGLIYLINIKTDKKYYEQNYCDNYYPSLNDGFLRKLLIDFSTWFSFKKKQNLIKKYFKNKKEVNLLDYGCGNGVFLSRIKDKFFKKEGVEKNVKGIKQAKEKGLNIYDEKQLDKIKDQSKDVITLWHVLEHLPNPVETLNKLRNKLTKEGILIIATPNTDSFGFNVGKMNWFHFDYPRHLILYNSYSLNNLLKKVGLIKIEEIHENYDYYTDLLHTFKKIHAPFHYYFLYPLLKIISRETITIVCKIK